MKRLFCICIAVVTSYVLLAQNSRDYYIVKDTSATYFPKKERFNAGDSITVQKKSTVLLYHNANGQLREIHLREKGTFEISTYFSFGRPLTGNKGASNSFTPAATGRPKAGDEKYASVVSGIGKFLLTPDRPVFGLGAISAKRGDGSVIIDNQGESEMYIDIIWIQNQQCVSALSFAKDFESSIILKPGETEELEIDPSVAKQILYVVGTSTPIPFNTIIFGDYKEYPEEGGCALSIIKVAE